MSQGKSELDYLDVQQVNGGSRRWPFTKEQPKPTFCIVIFLHHKWYHWHRCDTFRSHVSENQESVQD